MKRLPYIGYIQFRCGPEVFKKELFLGTNNLDDLLLVQINRLWHMSGTYTVLVNAVKSVELLSFHLDDRMTYPEGALIFVNGLQSWTESHVFTLDDRIHALSGPFPRLINTTGDYTFFKAEGKPGYFHSYSNTYMIFPDGNRHAWEEHATTAGYTIFEHRVPEGRFRIHKECAGHKLEEGSETLLMEIAAEEIAHQEHVHHHGHASKANVLRQAVGGWTSWYHYYTKIDEEIILHNLAHFSKHYPHQGVFQIDDGWQPAVGDWMDANEKFPKGMKHLADSIHSQGHKAGLWLAPFIVEQKSSIFKNHKDWLLTYDGERLVAGGFNPGWGGMFNGTYYVLDIAKPEVVAHLEKVFQVILREWGYDLVKLDFLFVMGLIPRDGKSRGMWMLEGMKLLRRLCGEKLILGCGVPLMAAWDTVDFCRIGPDVGLRWDMKSAKMIHLRERISTQNALRNSIGRFDLYGKAFGNDPDVFILRHEKNHLTPSQRKAGFILNNLLGDLIFTSDDLSKYDPETTAMYQKAFPFPLKRQLQVQPIDEDRYLIHAEIDGHKYVVMVNLTHKDTVFELPAGMYYLNGKHVPGGEKTCPRFSVEVFLQLDLLNDNVLGSERHIFPGVEIKSITWHSPTNITIEWFHENKAPGRVWIHAPANRTTMQVNGQEMPVQKGRFGNLAYIEFVF